MPFEIILEMVKVLQYTTVKISVYNTRYRQDDLNNLTKNMCSKLDGRKIA